MAGSALYNQPLFNCPTALSATVAPTNAGPSDVTHFDDNPYASPQTSDWRLNLAHPGLSGTRTKWSWAYRRIEIRGTHSCVIEYNGRGFGYETVLVDGQVAARVSNRGLHFTTPIDFHIRIGDLALAVRIEIKTAFLLFLRAFRLSIDGYVVYCEGKW
jgi:hypothetical protein